MNRPPLFSSGLELANIVVNSGLLQLSWREICTLYAEVNAQQPLSMHVRGRISSQQGYTFVAFVTSPIWTKIHLQAAGDLVSSAALKQENFPIFESLCSKGNPYISIHGAAIALFRSHFSDFLQLKTQLLDPMNNELLWDTPLIITGHSLGGSVAALFTLFLLDSINPKSKRLPFCITYGSPFIGDKGLQHAVSERSRWSSCFLHVAGNQDPLPSFFALAQNPQTSQSGLYKPFGTFLFCSELGCTCVEDPDSVVLIAKGLESTRNSIGNEELPDGYYGSIMENLNSMFIFNGNSQLALSAVTSLFAGIGLQLEAIGLKMNQQLGQNIKILIEELEKREMSCMLNKRNAMNPLRKLNQIKIKMAYLEWYKKDCKAKDIGYYDSYKNNCFSRDRDVTKHKKFLTNYWKDMVEEAETKPQKERAFIPVTWLYAGTNYRRMIEPLDIAEYYKVKGNKDYRIHGRSRHYDLLEQWQKEDGEKPAGSPINKRKNVAGNLTEDSCFWADVEEAIILCNLLNDPTAEKQSILEDLSKFEQGVMEQINNSAVSPEIFLEQSSFMKWFNEYQKIKGFFHNSPLINFMKSGGHKRYAAGCF